MAIHRLSVFLGVVLLFGFSILSCLASEREQETDMGDSSEMVDIAEAQSALCYKLRVVNVAVLPGTFHWEAPRHLLVVSEGFGPQTLALSVATSVSPQVSISGNYTPEDSEISTALGFSVSESIDLGASSAIQVPIGAYAKLEAYANYQQFTWDIVGGQCWINGVHTPGPVIVGSGIAFRPIGVFFKTCGMYDCAAMGGGVIGGGPIQSGPVGAGDGGAGGGGASGAGGGGASGAGGGKP